MMVFRRAVFAPALVSSLALLALAGCKSDSKKTTAPEPWGLPQSSPANVLTNLRQAYVEGNIQEYAALFDSTFVFRFAPVDVENGLPESWPIGQELSSAAALFSYEDMVDIRLSYTLGTPTAATEADGLPGGPAGVTKVIVSELHMEIETRQLDGENLIYLVEGDFHEFFLRPYPAELARDGEPLWRIVYWKDLGGGYGARARTQNTSWGSIKNLFN